VLARATHLRPRAATSSISASASRIFAPRLIVEAAVKAARRASRLYARGRICRCAKRLLTFTSFAVTVSG
jgi:hypothetical protein